MSSYVDPNIPTENPDKRPLPPGWTTQYDKNYKAWFYVNTRETPPRSSWVHPAGELAPPPGPPPNRQGSPYGGGSPGYGGGGYGGRSPGPAYGGGYGPGYNQGGWQGSPGPGYGPGPQYGAGPGYGGGYGQPPYNQYQQGPPENRGFFGGSSQPPAVQQAPQKSGINPLVAGGVGLVGGALLMDAFENHEDNVQEESYDQGYNQGDQQGYDQGYDQGQDNGDNFDDGGGDF